MLLLKPYEFAVRHPYAAAQLFDAAVGLAFLLLR
jgi:hypothetical protein